MPNELPNLPDTAGSSSDLPAGFAEVVVPDVDFSATSRALYVGEGGDLTVIMAGDGSTHTFTEVPAGALLPIRCTQVTSASVAASISALF